MVIGFSFSFISVFLVALIEIKDFFYILLKNSIESFKFQIKRLEQQVFRIRNLSIILNNGQVLPQSEINHEISNLIEKITANSQNLIKFQKQKQPRLMKVEVTLSNLNALIDHNDIEEKQLEPR